MKEQLGFSVNWQPESLAKHPILHNNELHLWRLPLRLNSNQQATAIELLSDIQRDKYYRRQSEDLKQAYLAGRYYLLNLLGKYTKTLPNEVLLSYSELNKPYLSNKEHDSNKQYNLQFNFTDTCIDGDFYGVFAFCKQRQVGVDIEWLGRDANFAAIAASRYCQQEQEYVADNDNTANGGRCLAIWTRKEAFGKALGKGINFKMNALNLASPGEFELNFSSHEENWRLEQIQLTEDTISCVAYQGHQPLNIRAFKSANHLP